MKRGSRTYVVMLVLLVISLAGYAVSVPYFQDDPRRQQRQQPNTQQRGNTNQQGNNQQGNNPRRRVANQQQNTVIEQPILDNEDSIPDSLLHPRHIRSFLL